jgi:hypothetical protein
LLRLIQFSRIEKKYNRNLRLGRGERQSNAKQYEIKTTNREKKIYFEMTALEQQNIIVSIPAGAHAEVHVRSYGNVTPVRREEAPQASLQIFEAPS